MPLNYAVGLENIRKMIKSIYLFKYEVDHESIYKFAEENSKRIASSLLSTTSSNQYKGKCNPKLHLLKLKSIKKE